MNYVVPMPDGTLHSMTPHEAGVLRAFLDERLAHGGEADQAAVLNLIRHVDLVMKPEAAFGDLYRAPGYIPGWTPDP